MREHGRKLLNAQVLWIFFFSCLLADIQICFFGVFAIIVFCMHLKLSYYLRHLLLSSSSFIYQKHLSHRHKLKVEKREKITIMNLKLNFYLQKKWKYCNIITLSTYCSFNATLREQEKKHVRLNWKKKKFQNVINGSKCIFNFKLRLPFLMEQIMERFLW